MNDLLYLLKAALATLKQQKGEPPLYCLYTNINKTRSIFFSNPFFIQLKKIKNKTIGGGVSVWREGDNDGGITVNQ